jgi:ATP-binding cassette subfamily C protein
MRLQTRLGNAAQAAVIDRLLHLPAPFFRDYEAGDLARRALAIDSILLMLGNTAESAVFSWLFGLFSLFYLFFIDLRLALLAALLVGLELTWTLALDYAVLLQERRSARISGDVASKVLQLLSGIAKLRAHGAERRAFSLWAGLYGRQRTILIRVRRIGIALATIDAGYSLVCSIALFAAVAWLLPDLATGQFMAFSSAFGQFLGATLGMTSALTSTLSVIPLYERARPILRATPEIGSTGQAAGKLTGAIDISKVSFRYQPDGPLILDDVSISVRPGEFIALVGPSGSGKSTLCRLLLGFEHPQAGAIHFDGQDLAGMDMVAVRRQLGVVLQNGRLMAGDIFTNIVGSAPLSIEDAWEAARMAGLDHDIEAMPMGMHTLIAEGAGTISGGQKQRLLIARAVVKKPRILLFDEATSALDNHTQAIVARSLAQLNATRIVVAHRLSTVVDADRIYFMEGGRIVEQGSYGELMKLGGRFAALAERQLA